MYLFRAVYLVACNMLVPVLVNEAALYLKHRSKGCLHSIDSFDLSVWVYAVAWVLYAFRSSAMPWLNKQIIFHD